MMSSLDLWKQHHNISSRAFLDLLGVLHNDYAFNPHSTTPVPVAGAQRVSASQDLAFLEPFHHESSLRNQIAPLGYIPTESCSAQREGGSGSSSTLMNY